MHLELGKDVEPRCSLSPRQLLPSGELWLASSYSFKVVICKNLNVIVLQCQNSFSNCHSTRKRCVLDLVGYCPLAMLGLPQSAVPTAQTCCKIPGPFPQTRHIHWVPSSCGANEHLTSPSFTSLLCQGKIYCPTSPSFPWSSDLLSSGMN